MFKYKFYKVLNVLHIISNKKFAKKIKKLNYEIIKKSKYFDVQYYLENNPDVKNANVNPIKHYLEIGWKENRQCTPIFDGNEYLRRHIDIYNKGINPLLHYELNKGKEKSIEKSISEEQSNIIQYNDIEFIKSQIDEYDIISFDIFDTLLLRPYAHPTDLFEHLGRLNHIDGYKETRIQAEKDARNKHYEKEDITIDDIYEEMPIELKRLKNKEMALELKVLQSNKEMLNVYNYALNKHKKVIITSDMYLPKSFLEKALKKNGYNNYKKLYVSSDIQRGKGKTLFNYIINDLNESPKNILHIGDNLLTDYKKPRSMGISAITYNKVFDIFLSRNLKAKNLWQNDKSFEASVMLMNLAIFNHYNRELVYWQRFGYEYGGPVCYWYLKWIEQKIKGKKISDIIFVARDGYTLEKIFNLFKHNDIRTHYIYASRQIYINCFLDDAIKDNRTHALIEAFKDVDDEIHEASLIINSEDASREYVRNNYEKFSKLCEDQYKQYKKYINKQHIMGKNIAIVDTITGAASSVKLLQSVLSKCKIISFFWICMEEAKKYMQKYNIKTFSKYLNHKHIASWDIIEYIMSAPEYPLLKFEHNKIVYKKNISEDEKERCERYSDISEYSILFSEYMEHYFVNTLKINEDFIIKWVNLLFDTNSGYDRKYIGAVNVCADSSHDIMRPIYKKWSNVRKIEIQKPQSTNINQQIKLQFDDLKLFMNRIIEKKLSTMIMHQKTFMNFKNIHQGQDIVIVASGPTLQYFKPMKDCIYIGVNKSFLSQKAKMDYLFLQDFTGTTSGYINEASKLDCIKFYGLTSEDTRPECTIPESIRIAANAYPYRTDWEKIPNFKTEFAYDLSVQSLGCGGTVVFPALQFALWTNPRRIYLVGADTSCAGYFDGSGKNFLVPNRLVPLYRRFKQFAKQYYPYTEIISINPVGLKGIFKDEYTKEYLKSLKK